MKAVLAIVLLGFLAQGCVAAPAPEPQVLINLFGSLVSTWQNVTTTLLTGTLTALNSLSTNLIQPLPVVGNTFNNVTIAINDLIVNGLVSTVNVKASLATSASNVITEILNRLITIANRIFSGESSLLRTIATRIINRITTAITRITNALSGQGSIFAQIINTITSAIANLLSILLPQLDTCIAKLNSLGLSATVTRMNSYKTNATNIVNALNTSLTTQLTTYSSYVNTTTFQSSANASLLSADLLDQITEVYAASTVKDQTLSDCLYSATDLVGYLQNITNNRMVECMTASNTEVAAATAKIATDSAALSTTATSTVTDVCNCVANVTPASTILQKAQAKTCADTASAKLNSDALQTQANTISTNLNAALATAKTNFDACVNLMNNEVADTVPYVESIITGCAQ